MPHCELIHGTVTVAFCMKGNDLRIVFFLFIRLFTSIAWNWRDNHTKWMREKREKISCRLHLVFCILYYNFSTFRNWSRKQDKSKNKDESTVIITSKWFVYCLNLTCYLWTQTQKHIIDEIQSHKMKHILCEFKVVVAVVLLFFIHCMKRFAWNAF